ncbi:MAG: dTDP-4-dehydrorhamnose 3,5-epimerase family protein [Acetobacteraceae bacterium]
MQFEATEIAGLIAVRLERHEDERGTFARLFCRDEFAAHGLVTTFVQQSLSVTRRAGTLRGMHFQQAPHAEVKYVRCVRGTIHDVIADLRPDSPTYRHTQALRLAAHDDLGLLIPAGCAHGFQTLEDDCEVLYQMDTAYQPDFADGCRFDDPAFGIAWPRPITVISAKDLAWPALDGR